MRSCKMTKMHFQLIADTIKSLTIESHPMRHYIACQFADALQRTNPAFNRKLFIDACMNVRETAAT